MSGKNFISNETARELKRLLAHRDLGDGPRHHSSSGPRLLTVLCTDDVPVGGNDLLDQCYPATIYETASDIIYPTGAPALPLGTPVLLTVFGSTGRAVVPVADRPYIGFLTGDVETDGSGSLIGRPRVISTYYGDLSYSTATTGGTVAVFTASNNEIKRATLFYQDPTTNTIRIGNGAGAIVGYGITIPAGPFSTAGGVSINAYGTIYGRAVLAMYGGPVGDPIYACGAYNGEIFLARQFDGTDVYIATGDPTPVLDWFLGSSFTPTFVGSALRVKNAKLWISQGILSSDQTLGATVTVGGLVFKDGLYTSGAMTGGDVDGGTW